MKKFIVALFNSPSLGEEGDRWTRWGSGVTKCIAIIATLFMVSAARAACTANQIDVTGDGSNCQTAKFTVTTTELSAGDEFRFYMSAMGTFYIDCGAGGTLSGTGASGKILNRTNTNVGLYTCAYSTAGVKTIRYSGIATQYSSGDFFADAGAIQFAYWNEVDGDLPTPSLVAAIDGSLGAIFPTLGQTKALQPMFSDTFASTQITTIPENLFDGIYGCREEMFMQTFNYSNVTSIPNKLFSDITCPARDLFRSTFWGTKITSIPPDLFENIIYGDDMYALTRMFFCTFRECTELTGYIPPSLFGELNNSGKYGTGMMNGTFADDDSLATSCPSGTTQFTTGYEGYWNGHVACQSNSITCNAGQYVQKLWDSCTTCPENSYCPGGNYNFNTSTAQGITACSAGTYSPAGAKESAQCGRILHIGDEVVYLRASKITDHALHVDVDHDGVADYFGNMTTADVVMHAGSERKLKAKLGDTVYSIYDDTVTIPE